MKKVIRLRESDLKDIIKRVLSEQSKENINPNNLKVGDGGRSNPNKKNLVKQLQKKLMGLGLLKTDSMVPTGYFGDLTKKALDRYNGVVRKDKPIYYGLNNPKQNTPNPSKNQKQSTSNTKQDTDSNNFEKINASRQVKKQLQYMKSNNILSDKKFTILDDKNSKVYEIEPGYKVLKSYFVLTGMNKGDELKTKTFQTWVVDNWRKALSTMYNSKGDAVKDVENAYFAQDEWKVKNTPSGIFKRAGVIQNWLGDLITTNLAEETYGKRYITWETLDGNTIPYGFHGTQKPERLPVIDNANEKQKISKRKMSFGCINFKESDVIAIDKFIDSGQISVWLPDATDDIVQFPSNFSKKQDINSYDKYRMSNRYYTDPGKI